MKYWQVIAVFLLGTCVGLLGIDLSSIGLKGYTLLDFVLMALIFLIGLDLGRMRLKIGHRHLRVSVVLIASTFIGSLIGGLLCYLLLKSPYAIPVALGSGWYSYTAARVFKVSVRWGAIALIANMLRELLCMLLYPLTRGSLREAFISVGGATTMDTTLPIIRVHAGEETSLIAFIHGFIVTLLVPVLVEVAIELISP